MSSSFLVAISRWQPMASRVTMTRETSNAPFDDGGDQDSDHCNRVAVSGRLHDRQSWGEADGRCGARGNRWVRARVHGRKRQARDRGHGGENHGGVVSRQRDRRLAFMRWNETGQWRAVPFHDRAGVRRGHVWTFLNETSPMIVPWIACGATAAAGPARFYPCLRLTSAKRLQPSSLR